MTQTVFSSWFKECVSIYQIDSGILFKIGLIARIAMVCILYMSPLVVDLTVSIMTASLHLNQTC